MAAAEVMRKVSAIVVGSTFGRLWRLHDCINVQQLFCDHKDNVVVLRLVVSHCNPITVQTKCPTAVFGGVVMEHYIKEYYDDYYDC